MLILPKKLNDAEKIAFKSEYEENWKNLSWRINTSKRDVIRRLFLIPADTTYITARWQFLNGLHFEYYWSALHAAEKYLKAILLFNGESVKGISHDILMAYKRVEILTGKDLLPEVFPVKLTERISHLTSMTEMSKLRYNGSLEYLRQLQFVGGSDARYAMKNHSYFITDIYCFDLTIFSLRRLADNLLKAEVKNELTDNLDECPCRHAFLEDVFTKNKHRLRAVAEEVNYFLCPEPNTLRHLNASGFGLGFSNTALYNSIVEKSNSDDGLNVKVSQNIATWMLENVPCNKELRNDLKDKFT